MRMYTSWVPWTVRQVCVNVVWLSFSLGEICNSFSSFFHTLFLSLSFSFFFFLSVSLFLVLSLFQSLSCSRSHAVRQKAFFALESKNERTSKFEIHASNTPKYLTCIKFMTCIREIHWNSLSTLSRSVVNCLQNIPSNKELEKNQSGLHDPYFFFFFRFFFLLRTLCCATFWHEMAKGCESFSIENSEDALKSVSFGWKVCYVFDRIFWLVNSIKSFFYLNTLLLGIFERKMCTFSCRIVLFQ